MNTRLSFELQRSCWQSIAAKQVFVGRKTCRRLSLCQIDVRRIQASKKRAHNCVNLPPRPEVQAKAVGGRRTRSARVHKTIIEEMAARQACCVQGLDLSRQFGLRVSLTAR